MKTNPTISVITVVYNDAEGLKRTIESVIHQNYLNVEYIVVDGGSTDTTKDIINNYRNHIHILISEPDDGVYDAMNKGIKAAHGEWCIFMNSGDAFYSHDSISSCFKEKIQDDVGIIGGDIMGYSSVGVKKHIVAKGKSYSYSLYMPCSHQAAFIRTEAQRRHLYKYKKYPICADYECFISILSDNYTFQYIDNIISWFNIDGISAQKPFSAMKEIAQFKGIKSNLLARKTIAIGQQLYITLLNKLPSTLYRHIVRNKLKRHGWKDFSYSEFQFN